MLEKLRERLVSAQRERCAGFALEQLRQYLFDQTLSELLYAPIADEFMSKTHAARTTSMLLIFLKATAACDDHVQESTAGEQATAGCDDQAQEAAAEEQAAVNFSRGGALPPFVIPTANTAEALAVVIMLYTMCLNWDGPRIP